MNHIKQSEYCCLVGKDKKAVIIDSKCNVFQISKSRLMIHRKPTESGANTLSEPFICRKKAGEKGGAFKRYSLLVFVWTPSCVTGNAEGRGGEARSQKISYKHSENILQKKLARNLTSSMGCKANK